MRTSIQLAVMVCLAGRLAAQCPDGTPRPCSNSRNAAAKPGLPSITANVGTPICRATRL